MDDFWIWLEAKTGFSKLAWKNRCRENWKINLIGHMIKYLVNHKRNILWRADYLLETWARINEFSSVDEFYDILAKKIETIDQTYHRKNYQSRV